MNRDIPSFLLEISLVSIPQGNFEHLFSKDRQNVSYSDRADAVSPAMSIPSVLVKLREASFEDIISREENVIAQIQRCVQRTITMID